MKNTLTLDKLVYLHFAPLGVGYVEAFSLGIVDLISEALEGFSEVELPLTHLHGPEHALLVTRPVGVELPLGECLLPEAVPVVDIHQSVLALLSVDALRVKLECLFGLTLLAMSPRSSWNLLRSSNFISVLACWL